MCEASVPGWELLKQPQAPGGWAADVTILARNGRE
jgi:hypothetical protein